MSIKIKIGADKTGNLHENTYIIYSNLSNLNDH